MRGYFAGGMFNHSPSVVLIDDLLGLFVGERCGRTNNVIRGGLSKFSGHDDVSLTGFVVEEFSHRRDQKMKKGF